MDKNVPIFFYKDGSQPVVRGKYCHSYSVSIKSFLSSDYSVDNSALTGAFVNINSYTISVVVSTHDNVPSERKTFALYVNIYFVT